jgi:hypothetical protein
LNQQQLVVRAARGQCGGGPVEDSTHFLESEQITIERKRSLKVFDIEYDVAKILRFHGIPPFRFTLWRS